MEKIKEAIDNLNGEYAAVSPAASEGDIVRTNVYLQNMGIGNLPSGLVDFFRICGSLEYNGVIIYGTQHNTIVSHNEDQHDYYTDFPHLLFFGSIDDDIYTYNTSTQLYETRDINGMECWDEYNSFEEFFRGEVLQWL